MRVSDIVKLTPQEIEEKWRTQDFHDYRGVAQGYYEGMEVKTPEEELLEAEEKKGVDKTLRMAIESLTGMERKVIEAMYLREHPPSQETLARQLGVSQGRISQLKNSALARMQRLVEEHKEDKAVVYKGCKGWKEPYPYHDRNENGGRKDR